MLKVKLTRTGKKNQAHFRIVVNEARDKRDGSYVEKLGHYAPAQIPKLLEINIERFDYWISKGAQPTDTVASLVKRFKSGNPFPTKKKKKLNKKAKARLAADPSTDSTSSLQASSGTTTSTGSGITDDDKAEVEKTEVKKEVKVEPKVENKEVKVEKPSKNKTAKTKPKVEKK